MSTATSTQAQVSYELIDDTNPDVVVIAFLSREIVGPHQAREFGEQLASLIRDDLPKTFVVDFANVRSLGSSAFAEIARFARNVRRLFVCNLRNNLQIGASLVGLDEIVAFAVDRRAAINLARRAAMPGIDDTVDYPVIVD
jgi:anti-anti-sigma regulatory factor